MNHRHQAASTPMELVCEALGGLVVGRPSEDDPATAIRNPPGSNCAESFRNEVFALRDFCWCDGDVHPWALDEDGEEDHPTCPPNFEHFASGVTGEWYKYLGRSTYFSRDVEAAETLMILGDCVASLEGVDMTGVVTPDEAMRQRWAASVAEAETEGEHS